MADFREEIEHQVSIRPGISFSQLKRITGASNGVLQHHIRNSDKVQKRKGGLVSTGFCIECCFRDFCSERCIHSVLRKPPKKEVLEMKVSGRSQNSIASEIGLDDSTVSYHVRDLEELGLL